MTDFLIEIGCEELPPKALQTLANAFAQGLQNGLQKAQLCYQTVHAYATPRRLAVWIKDLEKKQPDQIIDRRGPALSAAFDKKGQPTKATLGFANSCGTTVAQLTTLETGKGSWLFYKQKTPGAETVKLLPGIVTQALKHLPVSKLMRWNNADIEFVRPVHWIVMLYGSKAIPAEIFGIKAGQATYGHRFHCPKKLVIKKPADYAQLLQEKGFVVADFVKRKMLIRQQIEKIAVVYGSAIIDEDLLDEVVGLVEWPIALLGSYKKHFLALPKEVLVSTMQKHQKCFALCDKENKLLPYFITVSNIESKNSKQVIIGNERVINARLKDAEFFYQTDIKQPLENNLQRLKNVIFQDKLGSVYDKTIRIAKVAEYIAKQVNVNAEQTKRAAMLAKTDLVTEMVREFPDLQGIMGFYYAKYYQQPEAVAVALQEQYSPRVAGDALPQTNIGQILAVADRVDTLVGIFSIKQLPTGDKDPFGLRRAVLGILRIIIEQELDLDLVPLIAQAAKHYKQDIDDKQVLDFMFERLHYWYIEKGIAPQVFAAVLARFPTRPLDFAQRVQAVNAFQKLPEAEFLSIANKRVSNILKKAPVAVANLKLNNQLLIEIAAQELATQISVNEKLIAPLYAQRKYTEALTMLAKLKQPIDAFFDNVMVMVDDEQLRNNRLALLSRLRELFLHVADVSLLT